MSKGLEIYAGPAKAWLQNHARNYRRPWKSGHCSFKTLAHDVACIRLIAAIGESVEVEGGQGGRGWEYLLGMPLWSEPLERTERAFDVCNFSMPPQQ